MTYALVSAVFVGVAAIAAFFLARRGDRLLRGAALTLLVLLALTIVFDNLMIAAGLFVYADPHLTGIKIGLVPIEDLAYPLAAAILLPALWSRLRSRDDS
ncbi:lycopene cyclase domain-containing protein [Microbacterium amylolyticum]|uniref:Lycopene cyclase domain-containing protein n=1 Tax=Microbacterium amylolyticum TaxID=936337 RepID=A0ABS4ZFV2_9MICO|nr:lycopene cyclase domain-containing protein [Microbacterium amylolyticum]MBP2435870.1 lycopene cyclase domain-containing protein [Microbacterium amylolyticum]